MASEWCDGFLKLEIGESPVAGESQDAQFPDLIEVVSMSFGSSSGFPDKEGMYAANDLDLRRTLSKSRRSEDGYSGIASLFGDDDGGSFEDEPDDDELKGFEGSDLAEVDACKFKITKELDSSSPELFMAYCSMQALHQRIVFDTATLYLKKATGGERAVFLTFVFNDVCVVGYTLDIGADAIPKENVTFCFGKCRVEYKPQAAGGGLGTAIKGGWDMLERTSW